jgi:hypothetical protein
MDVKGTEYEAVERIYVAQDRNQKLFEYGHETEDFERDGGNINCIWKRGGYVATLSRTGALSSLPKTY